MQLMKEIDYIFDKINTKKFLKLIKNEGEDFLREEIFECVKNPNKKIKGLLKQFVFTGTFFNRVKGFSVLFRVVVESGNDRIDPNLSIICFYSETDKKYRLLLFQTIMGTGMDNYQLIKVFDKKPSKKQIQTSVKGVLHMVTDRDPEKCVYFFEPGPFCILTADLKKLYNRELSLERKK